MYALLLLFNLTLALPVFAAQGFALKLDPVGLAPSEIPAAQAFLQVAEARLPDAMKAGIAREISVSFAVLDENPELRTYCPGGPKPSGKAPIYGKAVVPWTHYLPSIHQIVLHRGFLSAIKQGVDHSPTYACGHQTHFRLALATLLHELSHVYDLSDIHTPEEREQIHQCRGAPYYKAHPAECAAHLSRVGVVSDAEPFRRLTSWHRGWLGWREKNRLTERSPDPYELTNPHEDFAVNMEYFLTDPDYACRRPSLDHFFREQFGYAPFPEGACPLNTRVFLSTSGLPVNLDPKRVYEIQYFFASQARPIESRFGHAMFRLVICAPSRAQVGPDCLKDTAFHVVVGYRANVSDLVLDYWQGLTGGYPSQIFLYGLGEIREEYNEVELRDLLSVPLRLTETQKNLFVERILEQYWGYQGRYFYLTNNCATEARELLQSIEDPKSRFEQDGAISPLGMYRDLLELPEVANRQVLDDRAEAIRKGYVYPSRRELLQKSFALVRPEGYTGLDDYLNRSTARNRRSQFLNRGKLSLSVATGFYVLESQIREAEEGRIHKSAAALVLEYAKNPAHYGNLAGEVVAALRAIQAFEIQILPWKQIRAGSGYGIPLAEELLSDDELRAARQQVISLSRQIKSWLTSAMKEEAAELRATTENMKLFTQGSG